MKRKKEFQLQVSSSGRLTLQREVILQLTLQQLERAAGGGGAASEISCIKTICGPPPEPE